MKIAEWGQSIAQTAADWFRRRDPDAGGLLTGLRLPIRLLLIVAAGGALFAGLYFAIRSIAPRGADANFESATATATLFVACTNAACRHQQVSRQPMDFAGWPLNCEKCGQKTVYRAQLCGRCRTWIAHAPGEASECWKCAELRAATQPRKVKKAPSANPDDEEDGW